MKKKEKASSYEKESLKMIVEKKLEKDKELDSKGFVDLLNVKSSSEGQTSKNKIDYEKEIIVILKETP